MSLFYFLLILVALIVVHEFGHFSVAKLFGIKVEEFGIGFPPRLFGRQFGETLYSVNLLFFGGFVRIFGENKEEGGSSPRSFSNKPRLVQAAVIVAGIVCNILFAWLVLSAGYMIGLQSSVDHQGVGTVQNSHVTVVGVLPGSPADKAGIEGNDIVTSVMTGAGDKLAEPANAAQTQAFMRAHQDESLVILVQRGKEGKAFVAKAADGLVEGRKAIGIQMDDVGLLRLSPPLALVQGAILAWDMTSSTAVGLAQFFSQIFMGKADFSSVAGPIGIASIGAHAVQDGLAAAISLTALISINLALINVLPIPGLDGGRLMIIAVEGVLRRKISEKFTIALTIGGFGLLILLMLIVSYHDVIRLIG